MPQVAAAGARQETDDDLAESQPLLSPPAGVASHPSYLCYWTQAIPCTMTGLAPLSCQNEGCEVLVHHICQAAWECREGHDDVVARYCCRHHPNYNYRSASEKDGVENAQEVVARARVVNVESQVTTEGVGDIEEGTPATLQSEEGNEENSVGDINLDAVVLEEHFFSGDDIGGDIQVREDDYGISDYTAGQFDIHDGVNHFMGAVPISLQNRVEVKAAYMVEALTSVRSMRAMRKTEIAPLVQEQYTLFIGTTVKIRHFRGGHF